MDIFALKATSQTLFMGCRNHSITPVGLSRDSLFQEQVHHSLPTYHLDVVTAFTTLGNDKYLVSASRDKNLKGWSTSTGFEQQSNLNITHAHNDHIIALESSHDQSEMYSGSKDGIVHIWNMEDNDLNQMASIQGQGSAITSIAPLEAQTFGKMFVYGSQDKSLRICKN